MKMERLLFRRQFRPRGRRLIPPGAAAGALLVTDRCLPNRRSDLNKGFARGWQAWQARRMSKKFERLQLHPGSFAQ